MIQAFVNGQLSDADHELMAHHISTCQACASAVAAERAVRIEMVKLAPDTALMTGDSDALPSRVIPSGELGAPPVPELQLDFVLDRTADGAELTLPRDTVREVALDQLPPAPAHSARRQQSGIEPAPGEAHASTDAAETSVAYTDDIEISTATAAGVADSVAHAAAALASSAAWEPLASKDEPTTAEMSGVIGEVPGVREGPGVAQATESGSLETPLQIEDPGLPAAEDPEIPIAVESTGVEDLTDGDDVEAAPGEVAAGEIIVVEESETAPIEAEAVADYPDASGADVVAMVGEPEPPAEEAVVLNESEPSVDGTGAPGEEPSQEVDLEAVVNTAPPVLTPIATSASHADRRVWRWSAAAALLVVAVVAAYAANQGHSAMTTVTTAAPNALEAATEPDWRTTPSVLTPILDSAVYGRVLDVMAVDDPDTLDTAAYDPFAGERVAAEIPAGERAVAPPRRARTAARLPQIVSDPAVGDAVAARQQGGETLPEVVIGNAPARTTSRGGAVVISGVPDVPRLLRTTTHRPRSDVAYVLREYDASAAEPAPRGGVTEYRWKDATGSRLYVLSGPVAVAELRAYARRLQTQRR